ncbi:MAG: ESPR-type extended signal peptide-containing protein [Veillonella sp.]|nr:ESPR-type extended signal peptide-containing protein [Veillonella sp.]
MNRIYRVIWSQVRGAYVVVSEIAKSHTRGSKSFVSNSAKATVKVGLAAMVLTCGSGLISGVDAAPIRGLSLSPGEGERDGGFTYLYPSEKAPYIQMYDYKTPGNPGQGHLYTDNKVFGIQIGNRANARSNDGSVSGISIGDYSQSRALGIGLGHYAQSEQIGAIAVGSAAKAKGFNSLAMMRQAYAGEQYAAAIGTAASAQGSASLAMGHSALAKGAQSIAIGSANPDPLTDAKGTPYTAYDGSTNTQANAARAIAIGQGAKSNTVDSVAMGTGANVAAGTNYKGENFTHGIAIGSNALSQGIQGVAIGNSAAHYRDNGVALGNNAKTRAMDGIAIGNNAESGIQNDPQYKVNNSVAVGNSARAHGGSGVALGNDTYALGGSSVAAGNAAWALGERSTAIGNNAHSEGYGSIAMGREASALSTQDGDKKNVVAIGDDAQATGSRSIALGVSAQAGTLERVRDRSVYKDNPELITKLKAQKEVTDAVAIGSEASVQANEGLALGSNATVNNVRGVALGAKSETAAPVSTASETINGLKYNYAGGTADSTVSVGNNSTKRTITNVAAGRVNAQSTDAINGSQLYGVANAVGNVANSTKNILGGNAQVDQNGTITMTNIGDTGKNTVHEAIKSANQGWELQVDGRKLKDVKAPNRTVNFKAGKNIALEGSGDNVTVATVEDASFNSVTTGNVSMSTRGINAGGNQITNVKSGGDTLTNAANIGDISRIAAKYDKYLQRGAATYEANGNGKINMTGTNGLTAEVTGLKNTYVTSGTVSNDGKRLTLTRNDNQTFDVDISKISNYRLIANPAAGSNGEYKVAADGSMTLTVADADGSNPKQVKLTNLASKEQQDINTTNITNNTNKIAKGLSFQGDNNVKINKQLGDTLGITGGATGTLSDNNIGVVAKDGNLNVKLAKDLTGLNSVTAGSVRVGKHSDNKNYVTGLDNKEWNVQNPTITSGRAATEDQLKKVSDEIKTTNAAKTDYRLINNTNSADGSYSVENNKVDLKVKDEAHPNSPANTVTINNIASKTELDKLTERAVKYDLNGTTVNKNKVTLEGQGGTTITNLKAGEVSSTSTDAVNGSQLHDVKIEAGKHSKVTVSDDNLKLTTTPATSTEGAKYDLRLNNKVTLGSGNNQVVLDGTAGRVTASGVVMGAQTVQNTKQASETGNYVTNLSNKSWDSTSIVSGRAATEDQLKKVSEQITQQGSSATDYRLVRNSAGDGSYKVNDNGEVSLTVEDKNHAGVKEQVTINNIASKTSVDKLTDRAVKYDINNGVVDKTKVTLEGANGTTITNVKDGAVTATSTDAINGSQLFKTKEELINKGMKFGADSGNVINKKLGEQVNVKGGITDASKLTAEDNIGVVSDGSNDLKVRLAKDLKGLNSVTVGDTKVTSNGVTISNGATNNASVSLTKTGLDNGGNKITNVARGTIDSDAVNLAQLKEVSNSEVTLGSGNTAININGTTGIVKAGDGANAVTINGTNGTINSGKVTINGTTGTVNELTNRTWNPNAITNGQAATEDQLKVVDNKIDTTKTEIVEKGLNFQGDVGTAIHKDLGQTLKISGGQADASKLSENNIGVVNNNGVLNVKLAKDLTGLNSVTTGATTINNNGLTIGGNTFVTSNGFNANDTQITNVKAGTEDNHAVNLKQLKEVSNNAAAAKTVVKAGKNINVTDSEDPLTKAKTYTVGLQDTVTLGSGNTAVNIDGTKGIVKAGEGNNAVTINGTNSTITAGNVAIDGVTGNINSGKVLVNGAKGTVNNLTNITWDADHITSGQAATEDQLKVVDKKITDNGSNLTKKGLNFKGDDATSIHKDLGETLDVVGGTSDKAKLSDNNIGVVSENGKLNVKLAKELTGLTSVTTGATTINNEGLTIGGNKFVTANGFDANNTQIKNVKAGTDGNASNTTVEGSENINVDSTVDPNTHAKTYKVALKDNVTLGSGDKAININGTTGIVKAGDGANAVTINGTNGTINSGKVTVNGTTGTVNNLTNTTWDPANITSGQAATEDQLKSVDKKITDNSTDLTKKGLNFQADSGEVIHKDLGQTLDVVGGITEKSKLSDNNIGVVSENGKLNVKLAKDLTGLNSVTTGQTTINNDGLTINNKQFVTANGFNANNTQIKNVTAGVEDNDAVNVKQLNDVKAASNTKVEGSKNINVDETVDTVTKAKTYTVALKDTVTLGSGNTAVNIDGTKGIVKAGNGANAVTINGVNSTINAGKVAIDGVTGNINAGKVFVNGANGTVNNLTNITWNPNNITSGQAATEDQLKVVDNKIDKNTENLTKKGLNFQADSGELIHKDLGQTLDIGVVSENGKLNVKLAKDLTGLNSVTTGQTTINNDGLTIGGKKFVTANGFDANDTQIKNVKAGTDGTDAVNLNQLNEVKAASDTKVKAGKNIDVEEEINAITKAKTFTVGLKDTVTLGSGNTAVHIDGTKGIVKAGEGTNAVTINGTEGSINAGKVLVNGANGTVNNLTNRTWDPNNITNGQAATEDQLKVVDNKIDKNTQDLTKKGLNFKGDSGEAIHKDLGQTLELKGGESDASKLSNGNIGVVNENGNLNVKLAKNLKGLDSVTVGSDPNKQVVLDDKGVSVGGKTYISNEGLNANNQKITNVAAGVNDTDAVNVQQLKSSMAAATTTVKAGDSGNTTVETTVNADKSKTYTVDIKKDLNLRSVITTTDDKKFSTVTNGVGVTSTDTFGNKTTLTADNVKVSDGQNNTTQTTAKGVLVDNPTKSTELTVNGVVTTDKKTKRTSTTADGVVVTSGMGSEKVTTTVSSNGVAITTPPAGQGSPKDGTGAVTLTKDGLNNGGNKVVNMASGYAEGEDINNIADNSSSLTNGANIGDLKKGIDGLKKAGLDFAGDKGEFHRDLGQKVTVKGGVTDESKLSTANNIGVISDNNGSLNVRLAKDITGINSITTMDNSGHTTVTNGNGITIKNNGGGSVSLTSSGLNNGGNKITNVAPGEISSTSTDAVNGSQLNRVANSMNNVVNEVRQVGAMSSALSALKPMAYDPYEPTQIMAGYGNYRGDSALALGVAHYKNESMMLHAGVAWAGSNSHMMANAGVTWKVGNRDGEAETADRYRKGPISSTYAMQRELAAMKAENQGLKGEVADLKAENEQMKANIAAMMARLGL